MSNIDYLSMSAEFAQTVPVWDELENYVQTAIISDAVHRMTEYREYWYQLGQETQKRSLGAFVANYIEVVESLELPTSGNMVQMWTQWGTTLRLLEIGK